MRSALVTTTCRDKLGSQTTGASGAGSSGAAKGQDAPGFRLELPAPGTRDVSIDHAGQRSCPDTTVNARIEAIARRAAKELPGPSGMGEGRQVVVRHPRRGPTWTHGETMDRHGHPAEIDNPSTCAGASGSALACKLRHVRLPGTHADACKDYQPRSTPSHVELD